MLPLAECLLMLVWWVFKGALAGVSVAGAVSPYWPTPSEACNT
jgi:hypothetical protein